MSVSNDNDDEGLNHLHLIVNEAEKGNDWVISWHTLCKGRQYYIVVCLSINH